MTDTLDLDFDRHRRQGFPEVVFGMGKTVNEVLAAATRLVEAHGKVLVTRASDEMLAALTDALKQGRAHPRCHCFTVGEPDAVLGPVAVVAGMDGALPSVVGGLLDIPVIACPTSVGYGVAAGGHTALNTMLASCSAGVTVVNIDNGFGAGFAAATIAQAVARGNPGKA